MHLYSLSISVLIPVITLAITLHNAFAQSANVCTFTQPTPGELVAQGTIPTKLESSGAVGGSPIQISVSCNKPVNLTVSAPVQMNGPIFNPVSSLVSVQTPSGSSINSRNGSSLPLPVGTTPLIINLSVDKGSPLQPGNYKYGVKFTTIP